MNNSLVEKLKSLLNKNSEQLAAVLQLLNDVEKAELLNKLDGDAEISQKEIEELRLKAETIISLLVIINDNPRIKVELRRNPQSSQIVNKLKEVSYRISRGCYEFLTEVDEKNYWLVVAGLLALIADRTPEVDLLIKKHLSNSSINPHASTIIDFEKAIYLVILKLIKRAEVSADVESLRDLNQLSKKLLNRLQDQQVSQNFDLGQSLYISGLANILYTLELTSEYLLNGSITNETSNIESLIDSYCFNALKLFTENNKDFSLICNLLRLSLKQLVNNSIWKVSERSPVIKEYFVNNLELGKDIILTLLPPQRDSILDLLTTKKSIVLNMPTSSGKSLLAELYILFTLHNYRTDDTSPTVAYVVPTNALTNQVFHRLKKVLEGFDFRIETALPYYQVDEIEEEILTRDHIDILITTPEKLDFLVRKSHTSLKNLKLTIIDEAHNICEKNRGAKLELLLATIKQKKHDVNFLLLSPFINQQNAQEISTWLAGSEDAAGTISISWTPTKQFVGCNLLKNNKTKSVVTYLPSARNDIVKNSIEVDMQINPVDVKTFLHEETIETPTKVAMLLQKYLKIGSVMVLCEGPGSAQSLARKMLNYLKIKNLVREQNDSDIDNVIEIVKQESLENTELIECLRFGIAYHHSRMSALVKDSIENLIRGRKVNLVFATTTLAQGVNFPITTIIFTNLNIGSGTDSRRLENSEFWNIAGRAGRAFMDQEGHVITPYVGTQANSLDLVKSYITDDIKDITSTLNTIFNQLEDQNIFEYRFIKDNPTTANFFQYLSHILNITYDYNLNQVDTTKIRNILNSSFFFNKLAFEEGFIESQEKVSDFALRYINHLRNKEKRELKLADLFGVSDITFNKFKSALYAYKMRIKEEHGDAHVEDFLTASKIILNTKDNEKLAEIVRLVSKLPEINLALFNRGSFDPESIAKIIIGWVNGKKIDQIVEDISYPTADKQEVLGKCNQYVNSNLKSYVPWGLSIFQTLTNDLSSDNAKNLPSYIYYGVNNKEAVILSKLGVPRFAVNSVQRSLKLSEPNLHITIENMPRIKDAVKNLPASSYEGLNGNLSKLKNIVDTSL